MFAALERFFGSLIKFLGVFDNIVLSLDNLSAIGVEASAELKEDQEFKRAQRKLEREAIRALPAPTTT